MSLEQLMGTVATQVEGLVKSRDVDKVQIQEATDNATKAMEALAAERKFAEEIKAAGDKATAELREKLERAEKAHDDAIEAITKELEEAKMSSANQSQASREEDDVKAFLEVMRKGDASQLSDKEINNLVETIADGFAKHEPTARRDANYVKSFISGNAPNGGYLIVPPAFERSILRFMEENNALYALASKTSISTSKYVRPAQLTKAEAIWVGESDTWKDTGVPSYGELAIDINKIMARPSISDDLLEDAMIDMSAEISNSVNNAFNLKIAEALILGDGQKRPVGLLSHKTVKHDGKKVKDLWGELEYCVTGNATGLNADAAVDALIDMQGALKAGYLPTATWLMNRATATAVRKLKDKDGNYLWEPSITKGVPGMILGYDVAYDSYMPNIEAGKMPIAFGDFKRGLLIVNRRGMTMIRDNYTRPGQTIFNTSLRMGAGVQDFDAIKLLKVAAS